MNESDRDPMDRFERELAESLRRRADEVPATPLGYTDVQRRIVQRRRRTATMAAATVTLPAVVGLGFLAGRNTGETRVAADPLVFAETTLPPVTTTTFESSPQTSGEVFVPDGASYRCQGMVATDDVWQYYASCEYIFGAAPMTTYVVTTDPPQTTIDGFPLVTTIPPTTTLAIPGSSGATIDPTALADQVLVVDASGGTSSMSAVAEQLGAPLRYAVVATRLLDETMVMPLGADVTAAFALLDRFGVGGFDTWTPDLVSTPLPEGVTVVLVIGQYGPQGWTP